MNKTLITVFILAVFILSISFSAFSEETSSEDTVKDDNSGSITQGNSLTIPFAYYGGASVEAKAEYAHTWKIPFGGTGMLTKGNNMQLKLKGNLSPVALSGGFDITATPLAVLQVTAGVQAGSGWYLSPLDVNGVGVLEDAENENSYSKDAFNGIMLKAKTGAALQFDTGAVIPGDWTSVLMRSYNEIYYHALTSAETGDFWVFEGVKDNLSGLKYYASHVLGYSTPAIPVLDLIGCMLETETYISHRNDSPAAEGGWASDFWDNTLSALVNFKLTDTQNLAFLAQFHTTPNWNEENPDTIDRPDRTINSSNPTLWKFKRVVLNYSISF